MTKNARNQAGLLAELAHAGYPVSSLDELRTSGCRYVEAVPVLLRELERETEPRTKEWIVRTLSVPWAKPAAIKPMLREFRDIRWGPTGLTAIDGRSVMRSGFFGMTSISMSTCALVPTKSSVGRGRCSSSGSSDPNVVPRRVSFCSGS